MIPKSIQYTVDKDFYLNQNNKIMELEKQNSLPNQHIANYHRFDIVHLKERGPLVNTSSYIEYILKPTLD